MSADNDAGRESRPGDGGEHRNGVVQTRHRAHLQATFRQASEWIPSTHSGTRDRPGGAPGPPSEEIFGT